MNNFRFKIQNFQLFNIFLVTFVCILFFVFGCQSSQIDIVNGGGNRGIPIVVTHGDEFPSYLAGVWRQDSDIRREFIISKNGWITSAVLAMGLTRVSPVDETRVPQKDGTEGFFVPGLWTASYDPKTRQMEISIEMSSFRMQNGPQVVEGVIRESFVGKVSDDGERWDVTYFSLPIIHAFTSDGSHHVLKDGNDPDEEEMVFKRVYSPFVPSN